MGIFIGIVVLIICIVILVIWANTTPNKQINDNQGKAKTAGVSVYNSENSFPDIQIIENENIIPVEENKIIKSDIKEAISLIDNYAPNGAMLGNNVKNATQMLNKDKAFFSATKKGTEKMQPVGDTGKVFGSQMEKDKLTNRMLYSGQTEFTKEDALIKSARKNALVNAGFNAASMIVGQYYMCEINGKLDNIQDNLQRISGYLDKEYQGRLGQIISKMKEITDNIVGILNDDSLRAENRAEIIKLEDECGKLLGQANGFIKDYTANDITDYKKYENNIKQIHIWFTRQQILQKLLLELGNLRYILANGKEPSIHSHTQYNNYLMQTNSVNEKLKELHNKYCEKLGISIEEHKRKAKYYTLRKNTIGKINGEWAYNKLDENVENIISNQINAKKFEPYLNNKQNETIKILKYKGEYYNLLDNDK